MYKEVNRKKGKYKGFDILISEERGFLFYSVLTPELNEIIGGFRTATVSLREYYNFLEKQVDEYLLNPDEFDAENIYDPFKEGTNG